MPYKTNEDLPENITNVPPNHAQDIYREAFNHAWQEYKNPDKRRGSSSQEETAHKVAWAAVKKKYKKKWRSMDKAKKLMCKVLEFIEKFTDSIDYKVAILQEHPRQALLIKNPQEC